VGVHTRLCVPQGIGAGDYPAVAARVGVRNARSDRPCGLCAERAP
jgi:hypothetical protein